MNILIILLPLLMLLTSCGEQSTAPAAMGTVNMSVHHISADKDFALGTSYSLPNGESISCSMLRYYLSNFRFEKADGTMYTVPQDASYVLIDMSIPSSLNFSFPNIPAGTYTAVHFLVGVDSLRSTMGLDKRLGVLDVGAAAQDMYWSWNQGYIHFKLEGSYTSPNGSGDMRYHIGGFGGYSTKTINCVRSVKVDLSVKPCSIT
ncbi:MAG: MbnP family protein [bacterium]